MQEQFPEILTCCFSGALRLIQLQVRRASTQKKQFLEEIPQQAGRGKTSKPCSYSPSLDQNDDWHFFKVQRCIISLRQPSCWKGGAKSLAQVRTLSTSCLAQNMARHGKMKSEEAWLRKNSLLTSFRFWQSSLGPVHSWERSTPLSPALLKSPPKRADNTSTWA